MAALKLKRLIDMDLKPGDLVKFETVHKTSVYRVPENVAGFIATVNPGPHWRKVCRCMTEQQEAVFSRIDGTPRSAREIAERCGWCHRLGSMTHHIAPQLKSLLAKHLICKRMAESGPNKGKMLYWRHPTSDKSPYVNRAPQQPQQPETRSMT